jgi:hypothetical protein
MQVYKVRLVFRAKFEGMRYLVYNYRIAAFIIFSTLFYTVSVTSMALAWAVVSSMLKSTNGGQPSSKLVKQDITGVNGRIKEERGSETPRKIKTEDDTESSTHGLSLSNLSDTATQFPTSRNQVPLQWDGRSHLEDNAEAEESLSQPSGPEAADDEDEEVTGKQRGRAFDGDSGIGTSMESEHVSSGLARRRSSKGTARR